MSDRETVYEELIAAPGVRWAACEVGSRRIDEINILEATKEAMTVSSWLTEFAPVVRVCVYHVRRRTRNEGRKWNE